MKLFSIQLDKLLSPHYWKHLYKKNKWDLLKCILFILIFAYIIYTVYELIYHLIRKKNPNTPWLRDVRKEYGIIDNPSPIKDNIIPYGFQGGCLGYGSDFGSKEFESIPIRGNHDRDLEGTRMMRGWWPEFNWFEFPNTSSDRKLYMKADQDITRLLYNDQGEILSVICPQFGTCIPYLGCLRIEVTVSHVKGWINENEKTCRGNIKFIGKMWIDDFSKENPHGIIKYITENYKGNLPFSKKHAIQISGDGNKELTDPNIKLQDMNDIIPNLHPESYIVIGFKELFIGPIKNTENKFIDQMIVDLASIYQGNMFQNGNIMSWQVYCTKPELVDMNEYLSHVKELKDSNRLTIGNKHRLQQTPVINDYGEVKNYGEELILDIIYQFI